MSIDAAADCPLSLTPDQLAAVDRAAAHLRAGDREAFTQTVYDRLTGQLIGPGSLHRALAAAQREFLQVKPLLRTGMRTGPYKYGR